MHFHAVFGESHVGAERQSPWIVRDESVKVLGDESTQTLAIASSGGRMGRAGGDQQLSSNQDELGLFHGVILHPY
jgi:hypothetical protein